MFLNRLLYRSDVALAGSPREVEDQVAVLIAQAQEANRALGLSGALLLTPGVFLQVLEGPATVVETTFERICRDMRHRRVRLLEFAAVPTRLFGDWSMARVPVADLPSLAPMQAGIEAGQFDAAVAGAAVRTMHALLRTGGLLAHPSPGKHPAGPRPAS